MGSALRDTGLLSALEAEPLQQSRGRLSVGCGASFSRGRLIIVSCVAEGLWAQVLSQGHCCALNVARVAPGAPCKGGGLGVF
jgi:hypothetical protein